jgi:hypothetical protein
MVAPFNQAWMLLKQRGHELNLPPQSVGIKGMGNPQDLTDRRVDEASMGREALDEFEHLNSLRHPTFSNSREAKNELRRRQEITNAMENQLQAASRAEGNEQFLQDGQSELDRAILARMGQQPEADEMEAMGVPPMSRTLSATPPPNIGRAGSTDIGEETMSAMDEGVLSPEHITDFQDFNYRKRRDPVTGDLFNPFPKTAGQNVRGDLMDWAAGAGREAGTPQQTEFSEPSHMQNNQLHENNPAAHKIANPSINLRVSPRQQKRGQMDSGRNEFRRPGDESSKRMPSSQRMLQQMGL